MAIFVGKEPRFTVAGTRHIQGASLVIVPLFWYKPLPLSVSFVEVLQTLADTRGGMDVTIRTLKVCTVSKAEVITEDLVFF